MMKRYIYNIMFACAGAMMTTACSDEEGGGVPQVVTAPAAISFSTDLSQPATRLTTGLTSDLKGLQAMPEGFGVFAYLTETTPMAELLPASPVTGLPSKKVSDYDKFTNFFMQNQQVRWTSSWRETNADGTPKTDAEGKEIWHDDWVYEPLKYWPNYTNNDNETPDGNETPGPRNISFFAYAPWADVSTSPAAGVINYTRADDRTPHVIYKIGTADQQVDLLWANCLDARRNGEGLIVVGYDHQGKDSLIFQKVPLRFGHALSAIDIYVQRVYDEEAFTGKVPDSLLYTKLFVSNLVIESTALDTDGKNGLQKTGKLSLIDGTWEDYTDTWTTPGTPTNAWTSGPVTLTYDETMFNDTIRGTMSTAVDFIRNAELEKWGIDGFGVDEREQWLLKNHITQVLIPRRVTLVPTLTYSMVTGDDALRVNYLTDSDGHRYSRIVNTVTGNSLTLDLTAGKRYSLLIRIGVEHVTFSLLSIVDWDFPLRFDPKVVTDFQDDITPVIIDEKEINGKAES